jgi:catechol 2,3-dioxygenase-like lactoylglutathione lyase family enzyme
MGKIQIPAIDAGIKRLLALPPVTQIGMVVQDIDKAIQYYSQWFGVGPWEVVTPEISNQTYRGQAANFRLQFAFADHGDLQWELIKVLEGRTIYEDDLGKNGEGLHHVRCRVDNLDERIEAAKKVGIEVIQSGVIQIGQRGDVKAKFVYLDTRFIAGLTLELSQRFYEEV